MNKLLIAAGLALALGLPGLASAAPAATPLPSGSYHCKAGSSRLMITLGDMQISGNHYTFRDPNGGSTSGTYSAGGTSYRWSGDIGAIKHSQIVESGHDATGNAFYFTYRVGSSSPTTASCVM